MRRPVKDRQEIEETWKLEGRRASESDFIDAGRRRIPTPSHSDHRRTACRWLARLLYDALLGRRPQHTRTTWICPIRSSPAMRLS